MALFFIISCAGGRTPSTAPDGSPKISEDLKQKLEHGVFTSSTGNAVRVAVLYDNVKPGHLINAEFMDLDKQGIYNLAANKNVLHIEENYRVKADLFYATHQIGARTAWGQGYTGQKFGGSSTNIRLAVVDTGVDTIHADLSDRIVKVADCYNRTSCLENSEVDDHGHGTHVSGIVLGNGLSCDETNDAAYFEYVEGFTSKDDALVVSHFFTAQFDGATTDNLSAKMTWDGDAGTQAGLFFRDKANAEAESSTFIGDSGPLVLPSPGGPDVTSGFIDVAPGYPVSSAAGEHVIPYSFSAYTSDSGVQGNSYWSQVRTIVKGWSDDLVGGLPRMGGVSYRSELVGIKSLGADGSGTIEDIIRGLDYLNSIAVGENVIAVNLSFSIGSGATSQVLNAAAKALVEKGVNVVVSSGNDQANGYYTSSPGDEPSVVTVGAVNNLDQLTEYSSLGNPKNSVLKPDVLAPGGSRITKVYIASSRTTYGINSWWNHTKNVSLKDPYTLKVGTSQAAPFVTGLVGLMASKRQGSWTFNSSSLPHLFKAIICMSAFEVGSGESGTISKNFSRTGASPGTPERAGGLKDRFEGYGRISTQGALSAFDAPWEVESTSSSDTFTFGTDGSAQKSFIREIRLSSSKEYNFTMNVPSGADYDLYLFSGTPDTNGEPVLLASSALVNNPTEHIIDFIPSVTGTYYIVAKWISGSGATNIALSSERDAPLTPTTVSNFRIDRNMRDKKLQIYWRTNVPSTSLLQYGTIGGLGQELSSGDHTTDHSFTIDIDYEKNYYIRGLSSSQGSTDLDISTAVTPVYKVSTYTGSAALDNDVSIEDLPVVNNAGGCGRITNNNGSGLNNSGFSIIMVLVPVVYLYFRRRRSFDKGL